MRAPGINVSKPLLGTALFAALAWNGVQASEIKGLQLDSGATGTRAEIALDREGDFKLISLKDPDRLVVDLPASSLSPTLRLPVPTGVVRAVRTGEPAAGTARIVFDLTQPVAVMKPRIEQGAAGPRLVLEWPGDGDAVGRTAALVAPSAPVPVAAAPSTIISQPAIDPAAASSAATSRLISEIASRVTTTSSPATAVPSPTPAVLSSPT
ncbi:MAG: AMIN domain-containing protein, partial [Lysobacter sp.]